MDSNPINQIDRHVKHLKQMGISSSDSKDFNETVQMIVASVSLRNGVARALSNVIAGESNARELMRDLVNLLALAYHAGRASLTADLEEKIK